MKLTANSVLFLVTALAMSGLAHARNADVEKGPTFVDDVAPILHSQCVSCHRPGQIGPMPLRTYDEVRPWAKSIAKNVKSGLMPPWHADPGYGPFRNDRSLSSQEIDTLVRWTRRGAPRGDGKVSVPDVDWGDGNWTLGKPDYVIELEAVEVPADGPDLFHDFVVELPFEEDRWITGVEILPGNREVLHHVVLLKDGGEAPQGMIGGWAAGAEPDRMPAGTARIVEKGARIVADMHYHPSGTAGTDATRIGLHFATPEEIDKELVNYWIMNTEFAIPAGDDNYEAHASFTFPQDSHLFSLTPHMHYRGKDFTYTATFPDGRSQELLKVSRYDFNWQTTYILEEPLAVPEGTRIDCVAHWDNSKKNPANPDPTRTVRFGPESYDEMMIGFIDYTVDEGMRPKPMENPIFAKTRELAARYPGEIYKVEIRSTPGGPLQPSALHIPRQGEGGWYVAFGSIVGRARVFDIAWNGQDFTTKLMIPGQGLMTLEGTADPSGSVSMKLTDSEGNSDTVSGSLATAE